MGAGGDLVCVGRAGADHPDLDAWLRRDRDPGRDRRHRQRHQAVSDGGVGDADAADAADQTPASDPGGASDGGDALGRMFSLPAAGAAGPPDRVRPRARRRPRAGLPHRNRGGLRPGGQSVATVRSGDPDADAAGVSVLDRAQFPRAVRYRSAGARAFVVSARRKAGHRRRYPDQRRGPQAPSPMAFTAGGRTHERFHWRLARAGDSAWWRA